MFLNGNSRRQMFTGLVEETGEVLSFHAQPESWRLKLRGKLVSEDLQLGDSIAVNGCCLSVAERSEHTLIFDVLEETRLVTNLKDVDLGSKVNLERSLRHDGRLGGHFVTGHVDCVGKIKEIRHKGRDVLLRIEAPKPFKKYLVYKGCIAVDGISLTIAEVADQVISIWLIPHTLEMTNLGGRKKGDAVNLEFDLLAKYAEKILLSQDR